MRRERLRGALPLRFYRPSKVAEVFGVDPVTVWRWYAKDGVLPPPRKVGGIRGWWGGRDLRSRGSHSPAGGVMEHVRDARVLRVRMGPVLNQIALLDHISISLDDGGRSRTPCTHSNRSHRASATWVWIRAQTWRRWVAGKMRPRGGIPPSWPSMSPRRLRRSTRQRSTN